MGLHRTIGACVVGSLLAFHLAGTASAHFIWINLLPDSSETRVEVLFGDGVFQDSDANLVRYVDGLEAWADGGGALEFDVHTWGLVEILPVGVDLVGATKPMGVFTPPRGGENRLLEYYAKGALGLEAAGRRVGTHTELIATTADGRLELQVLFGGEPAVGAEVQVAVPGSDHKELLTAGEGGRVSVPLPMTGSFSARARVIVAQAGTQDDQSYTTVQHYATLVIADVGADSALSGVEFAARQQLQFVSDRRACYDADVRGLAGVLKLRTGGRTWRGDFEFDLERQTLTLEGAPEEVRVRALSEAVDAWRSLRTQGGPVDAALASEGIGMRPRNGHPMGREIRVPSESVPALWVREGQETSWEECRAGRRRVTTVLEHKESKHGRFVPRHLLVQEFDPKSGALLSSKAVTDEHSEKSGVLLPSSRRVVRAGAAGAETDLIEFLNLELLREDRR